MTIETINVGAAEIAYELSGQSARPSSFSATAFARTMHSGTVISKRAAGFKF